MVLIWVPKLQVISQGSADMLPNLRGGAWDPHNHNTVATITDSSLHFWDLRSMKLVLWQSWPHQIIWAYTYVWIFKCCTYIYVHELIVLRRSNAIEHAHIRDVDYNPKKQNIIVSLVHLVLRIKTILFLLSEEQQVYELPFLCGNPENGYFFISFFFSVTFQLFRVSFSCTCVSNIVNI